LKLLAILVFSEKCTHLRRPSRWTWRENHCLAFFLLYCPAVLGLLFVPWNRSGLQAFAVAFANAKKRQEQEPNWDVTMEAWLSSLELSRSQWEGMVLPWAASLFTGSIDQRPRLLRTGCDDLRGVCSAGKPDRPILYYVLKPGMAEVLRRLAASFSTVQVLTGARVTNLIRPTLGGFDIQTATGQTVHVDDLVFASSGPATLNLLGTLPGTSTQQAALQGIEFADAQLVIHTDPIYAPGNQEYWSFFNAEIQGGYCEASMWLADVLATVPRQTAAKVWKSWVLHRSRQPTQVLAQSQYRHMVPTSRHDSRARRSSCFAGPGRTLVRRWLHSAIRLARNCSGFGNRCGSVVVKSAQLVRQQTDHYNRSKSDEYFCR
jgi:predicted NAD/FAD-binding protein